MQGAGQTLPQTEAKGCDLARIAAAAAAPSWETAWMNPTTSFPAGHHALHGASCST
jgi:hypothetical protein